LEELVKILKDFLVSMTDFYEKTDVAFWGIYEKTLTFLQKTFRDYPQENLLILVLIF
jgi:hypothetical protein